jgi:hypothetical protein
VMKLKEIIELRRKQLRDLIDREEGSRDRLYKAIGKELGISPNTLKSFYANVDVSMANMFKIDDYLEKLFKNNE